MRLACRLNWHRWSRWEWTAVKEGIDTTWAGGQVRRCVDCGLAQLKTFNKVAFNTEIYEKMIARDSNAETISDTSQ